MAKAADTSATGRWMRKIRTLTGPKDRQQLLDSLKEAERNGLLDADGYAMLEGVLEVSNLQVRDIMVPRNQMTCVRRENSPAKILPAVLESGHSRFPVMDGDRDDIVGILLAKDLLRLFATAQSAQAAQFDLREFMRPAVFVPESKRLNVLLKEFRVNRNHMALVVDEYGGVAGLVTIEDVIEQIVGDIDDEFDVDDDQNIRREADRQFSVRGATPIDEFNEFFDAAIPDDEFDTVAGLVSQQFGRLPRRGESLMIAGLEFRIVRADRRRIDSLRITLPGNVPAPPYTDTTS
ncbi:MAG: transporter associated domain-containing protein [Steroidobacteraceae bacterium]